MSEKPQQPSKSLIPYDGHSVNGTYGHFISSIKLPPNMKRAYTMRLATSVPPSTVLDSVFTGWDMKDAATNTLVLSRWLQEYQVNTASGKSMPAMVKAFSINLKGFQVALGRASQLHEDALRDFFPASFEMPYVSLPANHTTMHRSPEVMIVQLEALQAQLQALADFPVNKKIAAEHRRGIEEFRDVVTSQLIPQVQHAIQIEQAACDTIEATLPQQQAREAVIYNDKIEKNVGKWLNAISQRPSSGRKRGE